MRLTGWLGWALIITAIATAVLNIPMNLINILRYPWIGTSPNLPYLLAYFLRGVADFLLIAAVGMFLVTWSKGKEAPATQEIKLATQRSARLLGSVLVALGIVYLALEATALTLGVPCVGPILGPVKVESETTDGDYSHFVAYSYLTLQPNLLSFFRTLGFGLLPIAAGVFLLAWSKERD